jgi:hypothetical protein
MNRFVNEPEKLAERAVTTICATLEVVDLGPFDNNRNDVRAVNDSGQLAGVFFSEETRSHRGFP